MIFKMRKKNDFNDTTVPKSATVTNGGDTVTDDRLRTEHFSIGVTNPGTPAAVPGTPVACHRADFSCHRTDFSCHRTDFSCHRADFSCHRADFSYHRADFSCHRADFSCHRADFSCHRADFSCHRGAVACHRADFSCHRGAVTYHRADFSCHRNSVACHRVVAKSPIDAVTSLATTIIHSETHSICLNLSGIPLEPHSTDSDTSAVRNSLVKSDGNRVSIDCTPLAVDERLFAICPKPFATYRGTYMLQGIYGILPRKTFADILRNRAMSLNNESACSITRFYFLFINTMYLKFTKNA